MTAAQALINNAQAMRQQMADLNRTVDGLQHCLGQAIIDRRPLDPTFVASWQDFRVQWKAATSRPLTESRVDSYTKAVDEWISLFYGQGISLPCEPAAAGLTFLKGTAFETRLLTPSAIHADVERAKTVINTANKDIEAAIGSPPGSKLKQAGDTVRSIWRAFFDEFTNWWQSGPSELWGATSDKALEYLDRAKVIIDKFNTLGGQSQANLGQTPPAPPFFPPGSAWPHAIEAVAIGVGVLALVSLFKSYVPRPSAAAA